MGHSHELSVCVKYYDSTVFMRETLQLSETVSASLCSWPYITLVCSPCRAANGLHLCLLLTQHTCR